MFNIISRIFTILLSGMLCIIIFISGCLLLYMKISTPIMYTISEKEQIQQERIYKAMLAEFTLPESTTVRSAGLARRNFNYGYRLECKDLNDFSLIGNDMKQQLIKNGYEVNVTRNKIIGVKGDYVIEVYKSPYPGISSKHEWYFYIKPDDVFEYGYLDFGSFTSRDPFGWFSKDDE